MSRNTIFALLNRQDGAQNRIPGDGGPDKLRATLETTPHYVETEAQSNSPGGALAQERTPEEGVPRVQRILEAAIFLPVLVYGQAIFYDFVYDDHAQIGLNPWIRSLHNLPQFFTHSVWGFMNKVDAHSYYRPLQFVWFTICYQLFGDSASGWHAASLLLHLAVVGAVFWCAMELLQDRWTAAFGALLFAIHPIHCEVIAWVAGVPEPLCTFFAVSSFAAYLRARGERSFVTAWQVLSWILGLAALLSKETGFCLPILVFSHRILSESSSAYTAWSRFKKGFLAALPYAAISMLVLTVRHFVLRGTHTTQAIELRQSLIWAPGALLFYVRQLAFPFRLALFYELPLSGVGRIELMFSWFVLIAAAAGSAYFLIMRKWYTELFLLVWVTAALLPAVAVTGTLGLEEAVHDRYLYLPSVGFCLLIAEGLARARRSRTSTWPRAAWTVGIVLCAGYVVSSALETRPWRNDLAVCENAAKRSPGNALALTSYGFNLGNDGQTRQAVEILRRATRADSQFLLAWLNLGSSEFQEGDLSGAQFSFDQAGHLLRADQKTIRSYLELQLGKIEMRRGNLNEARNHFERSLAEDPTTTEARLALAYANTPARKTQKEKNGVSNAVSDGAALNHLL
jgi:protein O-mannosyl-transferase